MAHYLTFYLTKSGCNTLVYAKYSEKDPHGTFPPEVRCFDLPESTNVFLHQHGKLPTLATTIGEIRQWIEARETKALADREQAEALKLPSRADIAAELGAAAMATQADLHQADAHNSPSPIPAVTIPDTPPTEPIRIGPSSSNPDDEIPF